jgi:hypothetical protein
LIRFVRRLPEAGRDRAGQLVGAMLAPIILRGALHEVDAHHAQRLLNFTQHHSSSPLLSTIKLVRNVKLRECDAMVVICRSFLGEDCVLTMHL